MKIYLPQSHLKPENLDGISNDQIADHWALYEGYVNQVNLLIEELDLMRSQGNATSLAYNDRRRRYGFEYNGMVLHEYYFGSLKQTNITINTLNTPLAKALEMQWGSLKIFEEDFVQTGMSRGPGWAILYLDPITKRFSNHFIAEHNDGHIAGFIPLLTLDVWDHAYMVDHRSSGKKTYIQAFMRNINWDLIEERYKAGCQATLFTRLNNS